ncbi:MAG: mechanosensitive ion channel family protein [Acidimicrobiia bacterium]|nr:mechanosensitive ion channel family protein [Acidimicrobiia bacterium]
MDWRNADYYPYLIQAGRVGGILLIAFLTTLVLNRLIRGVWLFFVRALQDRDGRRDRELEKQATTIAGILRKTATVVVYAFALVMMLKELGFDVAPLIAGAGVLGLAVGFGAQNLVRDVIAGFFIILENQIRVGDIAVINDTPGKVEEINLRTTVLRDIEGTVHVFPNGSIAKLANRTQEFSYFVFNLNLSYVDDPEVAVRILKEVCAEVSAEDPYKEEVMEPLEVLGVDQLADTFVLIKARIKTHPGKQWDVGREVNKRLRRRFLEAGMEFPVRRPGKMELGGSTLSKEQFRQLVLEALAEDRSRGV